MQRDYPKAEKIPLPENSENINNINMFSPLRNRDINSSAISVHNGIDVTLDQKQETSSIEFNNDQHLEKYDKCAAVNLAAVMQTTVRITSF